MQKPYNFSVKIVRQINIFLTCFTICIAYTLPTIADEKAKENTTQPTNNVVLDIKTTEQSQNSDNTQVNIKLPSNITDTNTSIQNIKIDDNTTAKITIKATDKKEAKVEQTIEQQTLNKITTDEQNINISPKISTTNINGEQKQILTITDGVKNININFKPEIVVCENCDKNNTNKNDNKNSSINSQTQSDNKAKKQQKTKTKKNTNKKKTKQKTTSKKNTTLYQQTKTLDFSNSATTPRKIYENNEISCVGNECNNLVGLSQNQPEQNIYNKPQEKIIEKETKIIEQPVYVINRIINVDEDMELTDETLNQIALDTNSQQIAIVGSNGNTSNKAFTSNIQNDKFKQQYDIITANNLSYGEFAFIDDYND